MTAVFQRRPLAAELMGKPFQAAGKFQSQCVRPKHVSLLPDQCLFIAVLGFHGTVAYNLGCDVFLSSLLAWLVCRLKKTVTKPGLWKPGGKLSKTCSAHKLPTCPFGKSEFDKFEVSKALVPAHSGTSHRWLAALAATGVAVPAAGRTQFLRMLIIAAWNRLNEA